nr:hypothetical protein [Tanacetum cinerariifolium]
MGTIWYLCDSTPSGWCEMNAHSTDFESEAREEENVSPNEAMGKDHNITIEAKEEFEEESEEEIEETEQEEEDDP